MFGFPFAELLAEEYELRIIFPEGSKDIKVNSKQNKKIFNQFFNQVDLPFEVDSNEMTKTFSFLDIEGRPTMVIKKRLVSEFHHQGFKVG